MSAAKFERVYTVDSEVWQDAINIIFSTDIRQSATDLLSSHEIKGKTYLPDKDTNAIVITVNEEHYNGYWMLFHIQSTDEGLIVHESFHLTVSLLKSRPIKFTSNTEEVYAYTIQWVYNQIVKLYRQAFSEYETQLANG